MHITNYQLHMGPATPPNRRSRTKPETVNERVFLLQLGTTGKSTGHTEQQKWQIRIEFNHAMLNFKE